jgi:DNA-binding transcriptional ArsR family regulator
MANREDREQLDRLYEKVSGYFGLFSEPMRLRILHCLCDGEKSVTDVVQNVEGTQTNVSRHLALMHKQGVLARRKDGITVFYSIADENAVALCRSVCTQLAARMDENRLTPKAVRTFMVQSS